MRTLGTLIVTTVVLAACSRQPGASGTSATATLSTSSAARTAAVVDASTDPGAASKHTSDFPIESFDLGAGSMAILNLAKHPVRVSSAVAMERRQPDGTWKAEPGVDRDLGYRMVETCSAEAAPTDGCVELAGGQAFFPAPFSGLRCASQCNKACKDDGPAGPGEFRFVVTECGASDVSLVGPVFSLARLTASRLARSRLVQGLTKAVAVRLSQPLKLDMAAEPIEGRLLGFTKQGTARDVSPAALDTLRAALTKEDGFDDAIMNRCVMEQLVGLQLTRALPVTIYGEGEAGTSEVVTDLVLDLHCQRIFFRTRALMTRLGPRPATKASVEWTNFGPSHAAIVALARSLLPDDREINALQ